jgi:Calcineurin-like phosphoesterase
VPGRPVWLRRGPRWPGGQWWQHAASSSLVFRAESGRSGGSSPDPATVRIGHLSDPHLTALDGDRSAVDLAARFGDQADTTAGLRNALAACADRGAAFAVITGDLTDHGTEEEFRRVTGTITAAPLPVEIVPGNHDHYGHQHQPRPGDTPRGAGFLGSATVTRYEQAMGPRWWSADLAGLHLIGLDWFSARCGIDPAEQQQFVTADLATRTPGLPVVVLAHDQPDDETLALIRGAAGPPGMLALLTGHWHATAERVTGGCHFLSTPAACFGGLDWSPPQLRMITIDAPGGEVRLQHAEIPVAPADQGGTGQGRPRHRGPAPAVATARRKLGTRQHLGTLATVSGTVVAATTDASGAGWLSCVHPGQGTLWTMRAAAEPIGGLLAARGRILASGTAGTIVAAPAPPPASRTGHTSCPPGTAAASSPPPSPPGRAR